MCKRFVNVNAALCGLLCLGLLIWQLSAPAFAQGQPQAALAGKSVLVLHAFESSMPVNEVTDRGLRASLDSGGVSIRNQFFEYLDLARNPGPEHRKLMADLMRLRYGQRKIDMIITVYAEALQFLLTEGRDIFPDVPILTLYMSPGIELPKTNRRLIDHQVSYDMVGTLEIALKLVPGAKRVYVVGGVHYSEKKLQNQARRDFKKWEEQLEFSYLTDMPLQDALTMVSSASPGTIIFFLSMLVDSAGRTYTSRDVAHMVSRISPAPVFGLYDILLGYGIVGGSIVSYERSGTRAGQLALDILRGTQIPANIPNVLDVPPVPMFDWRQLRHWNLSESALPKGSIMLNKELKLWDLRYYIIGTLVLCLLETALIIILIAQRRRKKVAEEGLGRKTEELDQFFNISLDLLCIANTEGYFLRLNPAWEKILGYGRDELMSKRFMEFVHPDNVRDTQEALATLASQKSVIYFVNRYRCKDGTYRWLEWSSAPAGNLIYAAARDITKRKLAEQALEDRLRFERLVSDLSARFVNIPPGQVDPEINRALKQLLEFFQVDRCGLVQTLPGKSAYQITHFAYAEDVPPVPAGVELPISINPWAYEKLILKREVVSYSRLDDLPPEANVDKQTWTEWGIRSNMNIPILIGEPVDHIIAINSVKSERVWPEEFIPRLQLLGEIFVNALKRKQAEAEAARARTELRHVERSSRMGELTASLAHEINQPLGAILSSAQAALRFLESATPDLNLFRTILQNIVQDDKRAAGVITSLRSMLKREESRREPLNMNTVLDEVLNLFHSEAIIRNVTIERDIDGSLPPVLGDKIQLQQVLLNLVMNAAEAMSESPHEHEKRRIILRTQATDHGIQVAVRDFGPGIDPEKLGDIWQPLVTTKSTGLGLGLSVSRSIIQAHGGRISAENHPDGGAMFAFEIPVIRNQ